MKKTFLLMITMSLLVTPAFLGAYDLEPNNVKIVPEAIWAPATGGGTWVTEIQIIPTEGTTSCSVYFWYNGGYRGPFPLFTDLGTYHIYRTTNILSTIDALDAAAFTYSGRVGAVWFSATKPIQVVAKTVNGTYGKSMPGMTYNGGTTAAVGRNYMIPLMYNGSANRTSVGFFNTGGSSMTVSFRLINYDNTAIGSAFTKTFTTGNFQAFDPFIQAGVSANVYTRAWLYVNPTAGDTGNIGLMGFGSQVNSTSNDPAAILMVPMHPATVSSEALVNELTAVDALLNNQNN